MVLTTGAILLATRGIVLNILQYAGKPPTTKNYSAQNATSDEVSQSGRCVDSAGI